MNIEYGKNAIMKNFQNINTNININIILFLNI